MTIATTNRQMIQFNAKLKTHLPSLPRVVRRHKCEETHTLTQKPEAQELANTKHKKQDKKRENYDDALLPLLARPACIRESGLSH